MTSSPVYLWTAFLLLILVNVCSAFFQPAMQVAIHGSVLFHIKPLFGLAAAILVCSFASYSSSILSVTRLQRLADPSYLARVFSIREMATMGSFSASCLVLGYGAEQAGSASVSGMLAAFGIAAGLIWLWSRHLLEKRAVHQEK